MSNASGAASGGWPIATILTIVFVVLKLTDVINWSWWWVLSPLWISAGLTVLLLIVFMIIVAATDRGWKRRARR
jgi:hypothetical protein